MLQIDQWQGQIVENLNSNEEDSTYTESFRYSNQILNSLTSSATELIEEPLIELLN